MPDVLCTLPLPEPFPSRMSPVAQIRVLGRIPAHDELISELSRQPVDVLCSQLADRIDGAVLDAGLPRLRAVCVYAVGYNSIDVAAATERGVAVGNTPGVLTDSTADMAMGLIIAAARRIAEGDAAMRSGGFSGWSPDYMLGLDVHHSLLGIIGFGRIGQAVARRALAFGMRLATIDHPGLRIPDDLHDAVSVLELPELLRRSDFVSLHCPLTEATRHLIDESALRLMKPTAIVVNTARGPVVDENALVRALRNGWIAGAGLDVYEREPAMAPGLAECRNAVLAPHLGSATFSTRAAMAELVADNTLAVLAGDLPVHCVNPEVRR